MTARRPLVAANWKQNGSHGSLAPLVGAIRAGLETAMGADVVICPPFVYLDAVHELLRGSDIGLGAQDIGTEDQGAYTGEVGGPMLRDVGCAYVIIGHSERRAAFGDTDAVTARKVDAALRAGLRPILCVGESLAEREAGHTLPVVARQLDAVLAVHGAAPFRTGLIAYEPVWAIGTGRTATPAQAQEVHAEIRALVARHDATMAAALRILYGGSVKASNAKDLFAMKDIDGGLIGGASLDAAEFLGICKAAAAVR